MQGFQSSHFSFEIGPGATQASILSIIQDSQFKQNCNLPLKGVEHARLVHALLAATSKHDWPTVAQLCIKLAEAEAGVIYCTAWEAGTAHYDLIGQSHWIYTVNGRQAYEAINIKADWKNVLLQRFEREPGWPRIVNRRIPIDAPVRLMPIEGAES